MKLRSLLCAAALAIAPAATANAAVTYKLEALTYTLLQGGEDPVRPFGFTLILSTPDFIDYRTGYENYTFISCSSTNTSFSCYNPTQVAHPLRITANLDGARGSDTIDVLTDNGSYTFFFNPQAFETVGVHNTRICCNTARLTVSTDTPPGGADPDPGGPAPVPEPATWALMITGFGFAGTALRRRRMGSAAA